jgi:hypothetical protein
VFADMIIAVDDSYTFWLNGGQVGTGNTSNAAQSYCALLNPFWNIFAVSASNTNSAPGAGLIATIQIGYTDGTTEMVLSDAMWKTLNGAAPPTNFQLPSFSTASWTAATVHQLGPWTTISVPPPRRPTPLGLASAKWIWTNEPTVAGTPRTGPRVFRKTIMLPDGATAGSARILIAADDDYKLFVQGTVRQQRTTAFSPAFNLVVDLCPSSQVSIVVVATNAGGPAGLLVAVQLSSTDCVCGSAGCPAIVTDNTWKYSLQADPSDNATMYKPNFDDSAWPTAIIKGPYGMAPWGNIPIVPPVPT